MYWGDCSNGVSEIMLDIKSSINYGENMNREIHDIYDIILKIIIEIYKTIFLNFIGIDKEIEKVLKTEFVTVNGNKYYLDFLCKLKNDVLCHIEFQFPKVKPKDLDRFFNYNIVAQVRHESLTETIVINFTSEKTAMKLRRIGESKCFNPKHIYLGDIDFKGYWRNINKKVESNLKLTAFEEIALLITCLIPECKNKFKMLDKILKFINNADLFDELRFDCIQAIIKLEFENLISKDEQEKIEGEIDMTPQAEMIITKAIDEAHRKSVYEARLDGIEEGLEQGLEQGRNNAMEDMARNLKDVLDDEDISRRTGLSLERVREL